MNIAKPYPKIKQGLDFVNDVSHFLSKDSGRLTGLEYLQRITDKTSIRDNLTNHEA